MKTTLEKLYRCVAIARQYQNEKSKFGYACLRAVERIDEVTKTYRIAQENKQNELAAVDEKGILLSDERGQLKFTKENNQKLFDFNREQMNLEVEYEPYFATDISTVKDNLVLLNELNGIIVNVNIEELYGESTS